MEKGVIIGNDHGAIEIKKTIRKHLEAKGFTVEDAGVNSADSVDYPDIAAGTCNRFLNGSFLFGILCCGTGIGVSIAANKIKGIRCALPINSYAARMAKEHNNANFLAFGGRLTYPEPVAEILDAYIDAMFQGDRHQKRIDKIMKLECTDNIER